MSDTPVTLWTQHWNDPPGIGFGHTAGRGCTATCHKYQFTRVFDSPPPLSWEEGYDPSVWQEPKET